MQAELSRRGAALVRELTGKDTGIRLLTHCNAGALAAVDWGSALGVVRALHEDGAVALVSSGLRVFSDELERHLHGRRCTGHGHPVVQIP